MFIFVVLVDFYEYLNVWVLVIEMFGVLVFVICGGKVVIDEMCGMCLYFDELLVIVFNGSDYFCFCLFLLLYEFVYVVLYIEGLCDVIVDVYLSI